MVNNEYPTNGSLGNLFDWDKNGSLSVNEYNQMMNFTHGNSSTTTRKNNSKARNSYYAIHFLAVDEYGDIVIIKENLIAFFIVTPIVIVAFPAINIFVGIFLIAASYFISRAIFHPSEVIKFIKRKLHKLDLCISESLYSRKDNASNDFYEH